MSNAKRVPALDGVRGLAILAVLVHHAKLTSLPATVLERVFDSAQIIGAEGVELFFVLSGFLITRLLAESRSQDGYYVKFYARRALRIQPLYYLVLAAFFWIVPLFTDGDTYYKALRARQAWFWLYASNFIPLVDPLGGMAYIGHFWSLACEEQFYLIWPVVVRTMRSRRGLAWACIILGFSAWVFRQEMWPTLMRRQIHLLLPAHLDAFAAGSLAYLLGDRLRWAYWSMLVGLTIFIGAEWRGYVETAGLLRMHPLSYVGQSVAFGGLVLLAASRPLKWLEVGWLTWLGRYSYGIYVLHGFVNLALPHVDLGSRYATQAAATLASVLLSSAVAWISHVCWESRWMRLRERI